MKPLKTITIVGAGPSGLFCAYLFLKAGYKVDLYDSTPGIGRKFLVAGKGGLNITNSEELDGFSKRYGKDQALFKSLLKDFSPQDLRQWCDEIGVKTFIGSTGRIFPEKFNAGEFLNKWKSKLNNYQDFSFYPQYYLVEMTDEKEMTFIHKSERKIIKPSIAILTLGGGSWKKTGSDGQWTKFLSELGLKILPLLPMNCGFNVNWSDRFLSNCEGKPLKNIAIKFEEEVTKGEIMITSYGIEGGAIYAMSHFFREKILDAGKCIIKIDLKPDLSAEKIRKKLTEKRGKDSLKNSLRKKINLSDAGYQLLIERSDRTELNDLNYLVEVIKNLPIELHSMRPIDEAISTSGGICFSNLTKNLEFRKIKDLYCAGEMLDFETITGGYLLQGCFSSSYRVFKAIALEKSGPQGSEDHQ